jgi:hypothetical protein
MTTFTEMTGWMGTALVLIAYILVSSGRLTAKSRLYQLINLFGAVGIGMNVFQQKAWPAFALQIAWGTIALISLTKSRTKTIPEK